MAGDATAEAPPNAEMGAEADATLATVIVLIRAELGVSNLQMSGETRLIELDGWDSIKTIGLILAVEQHFGRTLASRDVDALDCVRDVADAVARSRAAG